MNELSSTLTINTPSWAKELLKPRRYKGVRGGRGSGKSHFFAECAVEAMILNANTRIVCIREIQKSLKFSSKSLIENKIRNLGVSGLFEITQSEIRAKLGSGIIIFQGMQDHTADSIKSLEGFNIAWVEEAQNLSHRSLELLRPTIREESSEIWFSYNPELESDAVDSFLRKTAINSPKDAVLLHVNFDKNPFLPQTLKDEMEYDRRYNPHSFDYVWLGGYNTKSEATIFKDKFAVEEFSIDDSFDEPLHGLDFGFAKDLTAAVRVYIKEGFIYISHEAGDVGLELDDTAKFISERIEGIQNYYIRADSSRPESISYLRRHGLNKILPVKKWKGSVEDGIEFIKSFKGVIIHPRCTKTAKEFRLYSYKTDARSGDILPVVLDENNHFIDALRYALTSLMKPRFEKASLRAYV